MSNRDAPIAERYPVKSRSKHTADVYSFRFGEPPSSWTTWAIVTICDATGELSIQSDWGNFAYRWNTSALGHPTLTDFLRDRADTWYLANKLTQEHRQECTVVDEKATRAGVLRSILQARREEALDAGRARELWEAAKEFLEELEESREYALRDMNHGLAEFLGEPWECIVWRDSRALEQLRDLILPTLIKELRGELVEVAA